MKNYYLLFTIFFLLSTIGYTQSIFERKPHDKIWLLGGKRIKLTFNDASLQTTLESRDIRFDFTNASICDEEGHLQFYTNGIQIGNHLDQYMENGSRINPGAFTGE